MNRNGTDTLNSNLRLAQKRRQESFMRLLTDLFLKKQPMFFFSFSFNIVLAEGHSRLAMGEQPKNTQICSGRVLMYGRWRIPPATLMGALWIHLVMMKN
jgi:hypothetical protein